MGKELRKGIIKMSLSSFTSIDFFLNLSIEDLWEVSKELEEAHG